MANVTLTPIDDEVGAGAGAGAGSPAPYAYYLQTNRIPVGTTPKLDSDTAANLVSHYESGNRNIPNYRYDPTHTAGGYFQITDTNWRSYAPHVGIDLNQYPTAISADYAAQRAVFDRMYAEQGFSPWLQFNPRLAEALGSGRMPMPGWTPSPIAFQAEENKSNSDVRYMSPEEYLDLLPPVRHDEGTRTKRLALQSSLEKGDNIESLPSLDVRQRGNTLHVVDWDGRKRAQAAIDAGVDEIPVAIRGATKTNSDITHIVGADKNKTKLSYSFTRVPPTNAQQEARKIVPEAFPQQSPALSMEMARSQNPALAGAGAPAAVPVPQKPDFYPEIVAGVNRGIVAPERYGYEGVGVPNPTENVTAGQRIANANATSAGRIGLPAPSFLSQFNPIGSAQAAEAAPAPASTSAPITLTPIEDGAPGTPTPTLTPISEPRPGLPGYTPRTLALSQINALARPLANVALGIPRGLASDIYGLTAGQPRWAGGVLPTMEGYKQARDEAAQRLSIPETPVGQAISNALATPANMFIWAAKQILGDKTAEAIGPYAEAGANVLSAAAPWLRPVAAPARAVLGRVLQTPEMRAVRAVNKRVPAELRSGGPFFMGHTISPADMRSKIAEAQSMGVPLTPGMFAAPGGEMETLFSRSLEHYPEAQAAARNTLNTFVDGMRDRLKATTDMALGTGSAFDVGKQITRDLAASRAGLGVEQRDLARISANLAEQTRILQKRGATPLGVRTNPSIKALTIAAAAARRNIARLERDVQRHEANKAGLGWGQSILKSSVRREDIRDFLRTAPREAAEHLRLGAQDALKQEFGGPRAAPTKITLTPNNHAKVVQAFGGSTRKADEFMRNLEYETQVAAYANNVIRGISKDKNLSERDKRTMLAIGEAGLQMASGLGGVGHVYSSLYWALRAGRHVGNLLVGGGGLAPRTKGTEIARMMLDPNATLATSGRGMFEVPQRPAFGPASQANIDYLSRLAIPALYSPIAGQPQQNEAP